MKDLISHLPEDKQRELFRIVELIHASVQKGMKIEMIILFGSYARGDFVEKDVVQEGNALFEYRSDFDLLVVTRKPVQEKNMRLSRAISDVVRKDDTLLTPVSVLVEDIYHINARLAENRYFYLDIKKEWIVLFDSGKCVLWEAEDLSFEEKIALQKEDFSVRFEWWKEFFAWYENFVAREYWNGAAFMLHQSTERFMTAYLLVKTSYKPKTHDLQILYEQLQSLHEGFAWWFDLTWWSDTETKHFDLLKKAYVDARYSRDYVISKDELLFLAEKVLQLESLIKTLCEEEIHRK